MNRPDRSARPSVVRGSRASRRLVLLPLALLLPACDLQLGGCPDWARDAIIVEVFDAATGLPAAHGVVGWVRDGAYVDTLRVTGWTASPLDSTTAYRLSAANERPGRYDVFVLKSGYEPWERGGVRVRKRGCGVDPAELTAHLVPDV